MSHRLETSAIPPPAEPDVQAVFDSYPPVIRRKLYRMRELIFETAAKIEGVGPISETLKWGEPAYLTEVSKTGSTIRMGWKQSIPDQYAMYFICRTNLVDTFRTLFPELTFDGNRAILFQEGDDLPTDSISRCIEMALTYHVSRPN